MDEIFNELFVIIKEQKHGNKIWIIIQIENQLKNNN